MNEAAKIKPLKYWRSVVDCLGDDLNAEPYAKSWRTCAVGEALGLMDSEYSSPHRPRAGHGRARGVAREL